MKEEYALIYKENEELKKTVQEMKQRQQINPPNYYKQPRKRPLSRFDYENEYDENENVQYIVRKKRKNTKKRIIYEEDETNSENDEIDGETEGKVDRRIEETIRKPIKKV